MYKFMRIFKMDITNLFTNPMWLFYSIGFPLALVMILGFLNSGGYGRQVTSYDYYGVAMMLFCALNTATIAANSFMEERIRGGNMRIIRAPVPPFFIHFSKLLASFVFSSVCHTATGALLHFIAGVHYGSMGHILALLLFTEFFASGLGVMLCCALKSESAANQILSMALTLFAVLGGLFFPLSGLGPAFDTASLLSPAKWVLTASFQMIYDRDFHLFGPSLIALGALSALTVLLSAKLFKTEEYV